MTENNRNNESQNSNENYVRTLQKLLDIAQQQGRGEYVDAIEAAISALKDSPENSDNEGVGMKLSTPADTLIKLAQDVRSTKLTPTECTRAAHHLVSLSGGR